MKRHIALNRIIESLSESDIVIVSGNGLSKEAYKYDRDGFIYIDTPGIAPALALGIAMGTDKRVFVVVTDEEFLRSLSTAPQMAVSGCKNLFYIILVSGTYQDVGVGCTIFESIKAPKGFMFNLGFSVFDYTKYFKDKQLMANIPLLIKQVRGPMVLFITVDKDTTKNSNVIKHTNLDMRNSLSKFIKNKELKSALFTQRQFVSQIN